MVLLGVFLQEAHAPLEVGRRAGGRVVAGGRGVAPRAGPGRRARARHRHQLVVVDRAGGGDHDPLGHVARRVKRGELLGGGRAHHLRASDHRAPERVRAEDGPAEQVEDPVLGVVLVHGDLLEDDLALGLQFAETRAKDHVGHHVEGPLEVAVQHSRVEGRGLLVGPRVHLRAHPVEDLVDLLRAEALGAAEEHVLDQMRDAGLLLPLGGRARGDPEAQRGRAHPGDALANDARARVERR